ncbi:MAG: GNAT family N-acetyltransferase [Actinomycetota bacterium]|nr:GNAT family N-acetyltransferase [Actinomycetota bacterium]
MEIVSLDLLDPSSHDLAEQWVGVHHADQVARLGEGATTFPLDDVRRVHRSVDEVRQAFAALDGSRCVGALEVRWSRHDNPDQALAWLSVHPDHTRRGVGTALLARAEQVVRGAGRHVLVASSEAPYDGLDPAVPFAQAHDYALARSSLCSLLRLFDDPRWRAGLRELAEGRGAAAACADPGDYRVESALDRPPAAWWEGMAAVQSRLTTDAPAGELDLEEEHWDAARMERTVSTLLDMGRRVATTAAFDASGAMVALTLLAVQTTPPDLALQNTTLVLREHRGRRLGLRIKAANLLLVATRLPQVRRVRTWNAEDNTPMLTVNEVLGFAAEGVERDWQKHLG